MHPGLRLSRCCSQSHMKGAYPCSHYISDTQTALLERGLNGKTQHRDRACSTCYTNPCPLRCGQHPSVPNRLPRKCSAPATSFYLETEVYPGNLPSQAFPATPSQDLPDAHLPCTLTADQATVHTLGALLLPLQWGNNPGAMHLPCGRGTSQPHTWAPAAPDTSISFVCARPSQRSLLPVALHQGL